jgi:hypothetical protein
MYWHLLIKQTLLNESLYFDVSYSLDNKYISLLIMESAAVGSTPELINLLILTSKTSLGNNLKNKFTPANLKRYKQIQVI